MKHYVTALFLALATCAGGLPVASQEVSCNSKKEGSLVLEQQYGEVVVNSGTTNEGLLVEYWENSARGSWSVTATSPDGEDVCLILFGTIANL